MPRRSKLYKNVVFFREAGFTVLELLVVITIIGILASVVFVKMSNAVDKSNVAKSQVFSDSVRHSLMANRVSEWKFDGSSGTVAVDTIGADSGTLVRFNFNANSGWKSGGECVSGNCLKFDGSNDYIDVAGDLGDPSEMTIDLWFRKSNINGNVQYLMDARTGGNWWLAQDYASGNCTDSKGNVCFNGKVEIKSKDLANNTWENVVVAQNASSTKIYLNGELKNSSTGADPDIGQGLHIGASRVPGNYFNGFMDEVRFYNKALSVLSIKKNYAIGLERLLISGQITKEECQKSLSVLEQFLAVAQ